MTDSRKKQQTLSSFFTKSFSGSATPKPAKRNGIRRPEEDHPPEEDDLELPTPKRPRIESSPKHRRDSTVDKPKLVAIDPNQQPDSSKTSRYLYSSSPQQENAEPEYAESDEKIRKHRLHEKFVKKLGKPDSIADIKRRNRALLENSHGERDDDDEEEEEAEEPQARGRGKKQGVVKKGTNKLTPMEKQVLEIKKKHMDTILVVEVGYKFRFFGEDARTAAKELSIVCIPGKFRYDEHPSEAHLDRFASASIPVHRLHVHVKRLVAAGHKVGVVRQLETAALKAAGDNRNAPFVRKLTNLYTKGTYIDDVENTEDPEAGQLSVNASTSTGFLLCMTETNAKGWGNDEKVQVGIVAVQPATGDIVYDEFEDGFMRSEIETRLLHLAPCEFLLVGDMSKATDRLVQHLSTSKTNVFGDKARVEKVPKQKTIAAQSYSHVSNFYAGKMKDPAAQRSSQASILLDKILGLTENVTICLSAMIIHLQDFGLEHVLNLTNYFQSFSARSHMLLNANTLSSLEVYQNQTDHTAKGSLFWTLDRTRTRFGQRLLRNWVGRPLLDQGKLDERVAAVEELLDAEHLAMVERLKGLLSKCKIDLEKSLIRIYYGRCTRPELLNVLQSFQQISADFVGITNTNTGFASPLITAAITSLPSILTLVTSQLDKINLHAAKSDDKYTFFTSSSETEAITDHKLGIASVEQNLDEFRQTAAEKLGRRSPVSYNVVAGIDYLIEVENSSPAMKRIPASWIKISGTKKVSRFHPPEVVRLIRERDQHKESLAAACDAAFADLLAEIAQSYSLLRDTVQSLAVLDCLLSLATVAGQPGYVKPAFVPHSQIKVTGVRHPMVERLLLDAYVPNDIDLSMSETRGILLTGPNMGGKSSYVRSIALISIMAQIGSFVPAENATLGLLDSIFTRMGAEDNMMKGESTFMVELGETSEILRMAGERSLVILDELGRGTSTHDGVAIAEAVLDHIIRERKGLCTFITHYQGLARMADRFEQPVLKNMHMRFTEENDSGDSRITFLYEVGEGTAHRSYGLNVASLANIPDTVVQLAGEKSQEMERLMRGSKVNALSKMLGEFVRGKGGNEEGSDNTWVESLVEGLNSL